MGFGMLSSGALPAAPASEAAAPAQADFYGMGTTGTFNADYRAPDWISNAGLDFMQGREATNAFFAANPQYAEDWARITSGQSSALPTDGSSLIKTNFASMSPEAAAHYAQNPDELLAAEGFGQDPTLAYMAYNQGPRSIGVDIKNGSVDNVLRGSRWTPGGIQGGSNNPMALAQTPSGAGTASYRAALEQTGGGGLLGSAKAQAVAAADPVAGAGARPLGNDFKSQAAAFNTGKDGATAQKFAQEMASAASFGDAYSLYQSRIDAIDSSGYDEATKAALKNAAGEEFDQYAETKGLRGMGMARLYGDGGGQPVKKGA